MPASSAYGWPRIFAPANTPPDVVAILVTDLHAILAPSEMRDRFSQQGAEVVASTSPQFAQFLRSDYDKWKTLFQKLGIKPGDMLRVATRRGEVELAARQDDAIPDGVIFIPFAFVEAAATILTNPALDPFGKIPESKFCAAKVATAKPRMEAAE